MAEIGGYKPGDRVGDGEVISREQALDKNKKLKKDVKEVHVDVNLNGKIDVEDKVIYARLKDWDGPTVPHQVDFSGSRDLPRSLPSIPELVSPKDPVSKNVAAADKALQGKLSFKSLGVAADQIAAAKKGTAPNPTVAAIRDEVEHRIPKAFEKCVTELDVTTRQGIETADSIKSMFAQLQDAGTALAEVKKIDSNYVLPQKTVHDLHEVMRRLDRALLDGRQLSASDKVNLNLEFDRWAKEFQKHLAGAGPK